MSFREVTVLPSVELERHYSVTEIASQWSMSQNTVRRIFQDTPGVIKIGHSETKQKRKYVTLRIPERVLRSVHARLGMEVAL